MVDTPEAYEPPGAAALRGCRRIVLGAATPALLRSVAEIFAMMLRDFGMLSTARGLVRSCHPGPTAAVTVLAALLALAFHAPWLVSAVVVLAVFSGQLVIGWSNDLIDADRDRADARLDKPLAGAEVAGRSVLMALIGAAVVCVLTSLALGWPASGIHLVLLVGSGLAYNAGVKATIWSFVPYAVAFGSLPAVVWFAAAEGAVGRTGGGSIPVSGAPPAWMLLVGALLGVGAHLLNVLPDLAADERHGIRGLPHRLGQRHTQRLAPVLLGAGTVIVVLAPAEPVKWWGWVILGLTGLLSAVAARGTGTTPFRAAIVLALLTAATLVMNSAG
ncbi:MAG: UbiA family prenyltransferase [Ornithinimicrobium sp.]